MNEHVGTNCCIPRCVICVISVACFIALMSRYCFQQFALKHLGNRLLPMVRHWITIPVNTAIVNNTADRMVALCCHVTSHAYLLGRFLLHIFALRTSFRDWLFVVVFSFPATVDERNLYAPFSHWAINIYSRGDARVLPFGSYSGILQPRKYIVTL
jgi:hypothetical protein